MPLVQIQIDQTAKPAGTPGVAREDLDLAVNVTLTAIGGPFSAYRWTIVDKPIDFDANTISSDAIVSPTNATTQVSGVSLAGTRLIKLEIDSGRGLGASADDIATITFYAGPTLATQAYELPQRVPAANETVEHNVPNAIFPGGNSIGWAWTVGRWIYSVVKRLFRTSPRSGARVHTELVGPTPTVTEIRKMYVASVAIDTGTLVYTVTLNPAFPDTDYGVLVCPHAGSGDWDNPSRWVVVVTSTSTFDVVFYDSTNNAIGADFTVMACLGSSL